jgi:hypothetical protein
MELFWVMVLISCVPVVGVLSSPGVLAVFLREWNTGKVG